MFMVTFAISRKVVATHTYFAIMAVFFLMEVTTY